METKLSVLRQFGSEQFSATVSFDKVLNESEMKHEVSKLGSSITEAFNKVLEREESEKKTLSNAAESRTKSNKELDQKIQAEMKSATEVKQSLVKAEKLVNKSH